MKINAFFAGALCALTVAAAFGAFARRAHAAEPAPAAVKLITDLRDTEVYSIKYDNQSCIMVSTKGGSGISLQCSR